MTFDATVSLDIILFLLGLLIAVWHLNSRDERRIADLREDLKRDFAELKGEISDLRSSQENLRTELRGDLRRVENKVDDSNQRLARLEGRFEGREERLAAEGEGDTAA